MKKTKSIFIKMGFSVWFYIFVSAKFDFYFLIKFKADQITQLFVSLRWTIWTNILFVLLRQNLNPNKSHVSCSCFLNNWCQNTPVQSTLLFPLLKIYHNLNICVDLRAMLWYLVPSHSHHNSKMHANHSDFCQM